LIVASFVNVNTLEESSSFGRIIAEQMLRGWLNEDNGSSR